MPLAARSLRAVVTIWSLLRHPGVPLTMKMLPILGAAYALWPRDIVPDFVPMLGRVDDLVVLFVALSAFLRLGAPWILSRKQADAGNVHDGNVVEGDYRVVRTEPRD